LRNVAGDHRISRSVKFGRRSSNHSQGTGCASPPVPLPAHRQLNVVSLDLCRRSDGKERDIDRLRLSDAKKQSRGRALCAFTPASARNREISLLPILSVGRSFCFYPCQVSGLSNYYEVTPRMAEQTRIHIAELVRISPRGYRGAPVWGILVNAGKRLNPMRS
jgi:hypothetical protein